MTDALSARAYGRWRKAKGLPGQTHTAVGRAIESGRLRASVQRSADGRRTLIDPELADREWSANTDSTQVRAPAVEQDPGLFPGAETPVPPGSRETPAGKGGAPAISRSLQVRALFQARLTQLEYEERSGKLCDRSEVSAEAFTLGRALRDALLLIPDRLAPLLGSASMDSPDEARDSITREITEALEILTGRDAVPAS